MTRQEIVQEYLKCKNDFEYFCRKYIYIEVPGGDILFNPYSAQLALNSFIDKYRQVLVLKSRQIGISTIIQAKIAHLVTFYNNVVVGVISKDGSESTAFCRVILGMLDKLPSWMVPKFNKRQEQSFILANGSKVYASLVNPSNPEKTLRGKAVTFLIIDEAAFIAHIDKAWAGLVPALATSQKHARSQGVPFGIIVLSTPNKTTGNGTWFYQRYQSALTGTDAFKKFIIHWKDIPELANDPHWYDTQKALFNHDPRLIQQELELVFLPGEGSFFPEDICQKLQENTKDPISMMKLFNGEIWEYKKPQKGRYYLMGVDTAPEFGEDNSAITIWDYISLEQVWEYNGKLSVTDFIKVVKLGASMYPGLIVVESNSYGNQVLEELDRSELSTRVYKETIGDKIKSGLTTTSKTRPLMIDALYSYILENPESVKSKRLALELIGLVQKPTGKVEGDEGSRDDLALATSTAFYVRKYDPPFWISATAVDTSILSEVMGMNIEQRAGDDLDNDKIMKYVKDNIFAIQTQTGGTVNTLQFYDGTSPLKQIPQYDVKTVGVERKKGIEMDKDVMSYVDFLDINSE